ncbi:hypothetical protein GQX73_g10525 [Xylaria multiplex]|uniref:Uncharacterized protein n=1 Tax=Xylaria multiplex TaxID=323545 RepID=A0A7C8IGG6_9PEZI|nr:hypothetical protein GQX73_g10525 [Xylaria multiplex]
MLVHQSFLVILGARLVLGGIGGAQVFYSHDAAFIGDQMQMDDDEAASVLFTAGPNDGLIGNPDMKTSRGFPSWSNKAFFIPASMSSSHQVGFKSKTLDSPNPDTDTSGFIFYGATALHLSADGTLHGLWYVLPTQSKKIWSLHWNATTGDKSDGHLSVTLRSVPPTKPF